MLILPVWVVKLVRAGGKGEGGALSFPESKQDVLHGAAASPVCLQEDYGWMCSPPLVWLSVCLILGMQLLTILLLTAL